MSFDPATALLNVSGKIIDKIWPNAADAAIAKLKLFELQQSGELAAIAGQMEINKIEAANPSLFVSGWRPFVGWVCAGGLVYSFFVFPLLAWGSVNWGVVSPPNLDLGTLLTILGGLLGLGGLRTLEKVNGVDRK